MLKIMLILCCRSTPPMSPAFRSRCINPRSAVTPSTSDDSDDEYEEENS